MQAVYNARRDRSDLALYVQGLIIGFFGQQAHGDLQAGFQCLVIRAGADMAYELRRQHQSAAGTRQGLVQVVENGVKFRDGLSLQRGQHCGLCLQGAEQTMAVERDPARIVIAR